jgi:hypothetical protein
VRVSVAVTCRVLGISRQAYYLWVRDPVSQRDWDDAHLIDAALEIHADDPADGYRFIADELDRRGFTASENRVWRICSMQQIFSLHAKKKGRSRPAGRPVHDDLVRRDFTADAPNTKWLTDITEHPTSEGKLYLCAIKDCYSNKIVGYSIAPHMRASLAVSALRNAIALRDPGDVVVHSDRGAQFRSAAYRRLLHAHGLTGSAPAVTTPRWNRSSPCCKRTFSTHNGGAPARNSGWRSCPGSRRNTTANADNAPWASSPQSSLRPSTRPQQRPETVSPSVNRSLGRPDDRRQGP